MEGKRYVSRGEGKDIGRASHKGWGETGWKARGAVEEGKAMKAGQREEAPHAEGVRAEAEACTRSSASPALGSPEGESESNAGTVPAPPNSHASASGGLRARSRPNPPERLNIHAHRGGHG